MVNRYLGLIVIAVGFFMFIGSFNPPGPAHSIIGGVGNGCYTTTYLTAYFTPTSGPIGTQVSIYGCAVNAGDTLQEGSFGTTLYTTSGSDGSYSFHDTVPNYAYPCGANGVSTTYSIEVKDTTNGQYAFGNPPSYANFVVTCTPAGGTTTTTTSTTAAATTTSMTTRVTQTTVAVTQTTTALSTVTSVATTTNAYGQTVTSTQTQVQTQVQTNVVQSVSAYTTTDTGAPSGGAGVAPTLTALGVAGLVVMLGGAIIYARGSGRRR